MFKKFTNGCVRVVNRWLPDPFLFAIILTIVVFIGAMLGTQQGPVTLLTAWQRFLGSPGIRNADGSGSRTGLCHGFCICLQESSRSYCKHSKNKRKSYCHRNTCFYNLLLA